MRAANTWKLFACWSDTVGTVHTTSHSWRTCQTSSEVRTWHTGSKPRDSLLSDVSSCFVTNTQNIQVSCCVQWPVCSQLGTSWPVWHSEFSSVPSTFDMPPLLCTHQNREYKPGNYLTPHPPLHLDENTLVCDSEQNSEKFKLQPDVCIAVATSGAVVDSWCTHMMSVVRLNDYNSGYY